MPVLSFPIDVSSDAAGSLRRVRRRADGSKELGGYIVTSVGRGKRHAI
jgi:hypothetical protein